MSWKAGIAAEVIALPSRSIGEALYQAKIFFSAPEMFAWTLAILILSVLLEQGILLIMRFINRHIEGGAP
jgi:NitT/TauT family transport system permease protein